MADISTIAAFFLPMYLREDTQRKAHECAQPVWGLETIKPICAGLR